MGEPIVLSEEQKALASSFLVPFESAEQLRDWAYVFLGIDFPLGRIDPDSNSSPAEWLFDAYTSIRNNLGGQKPTYVVYSARECYKTLSCAALEVILMAHFNLTIAHMAAIEPQSKKAVQYISSFLRKINPFLEYHGSKVESQNTRNIVIKNDQGDLCYLVIIICTLTGANCISPESTIHYFDGSSKLAKHVVPGDVLKTWDYSQNKEVPVTVGSISYAKKQSRELVFDDGSNIIVSDDHQVFTHKGWIPSCKVKVGDRFTASGSDVIRTEYSENEVSVGDLKQLVLGTLLGDSSVTKTKNHVRFQVSHCARQLKYLEFMKRTFDFNDIPCSIIPDGTQFKLTTKTHEFFRPFREIYSPKKTITKELLNELTYEGIAYWFMDDVRGNPYKVGSNKDHRFQLASCGFTLDENTIIVDFFREKGFDCWISSQGKYNLVEFSLESSRKLSDLMSPYFVTCMRYKLLTSLNHDFTRFVDSGELTPGIDKNGFKSKKDLSSTRKGRKYGTTIRKRLTSKVVRINLIGEQPLIDIHIDTKNEHHKSFFCNSMKLVHNSEHTNIMVIDEVDVVRFPQAYEEAKLIPGMLRGRYPITIMTSTRKFAFGLMQKEIEMANEHGHPVLHWNILDITEQCSPKRHLPDEPKEDRYVARRLPLRNLSEREYVSLQEEKKADYDKITAHKGCATCSLLPVCKTRLASRPDKDIGGLYKPIDFTINQFKKINPDMAEAQLLCWKPSSTGLIYGRFDATEGENVITLDQAYEAYTGIERQGTNIEDLIDLFHKKGIQFYVGGDWGFRHAFALIAIAVMPNKEFWVFETLAMPGLEYEDMIKYAIAFRDKYHPKKWFMDTAQPMFIKGFRRRKMVCKDFKKDVMGGIESVRGQIVDASNKRRLKILKTEENAFLIKGFANHHFRLDSAGNITPEPDDEEYADVMDSMRYIGQNLFTPKGQGLKVGAGDYKAEAHRRQRQELYERSPEKAHSDIILNKIKKLATEGSGESKGKSASGTILWDFGDPLDS